jgi:hypothetical protein
LEEALNPSDRRILIIVVSVFLLACICSLCIAGFSALELIFSNFSLTTTTTTSTTEIDRATLEQMLHIEEQVIEIRGLQPSGEVTRALYTPEDLRRRVMEDFFADYTAEEAAQDTLVLSIFGLVPPDLDLLQLYIDLYSEGIAGFYDDETGEMVVIQEADFGGIEQLTYAHEYDHFLQDQNYDLSDGLGYNDETCEEDSEFCLALQALVEGGATLTELSWFDEYASSRLREDVYDFYEDYESPIFDDAPPFLQQDMLYAYTAGYLFVQSLYDQGGWPAVDAAFADPPRTTEHIMHPELYPGELPIPVVLPDLTPILGVDWQLLEEDTLGEWYTYMLLGFPFESRAALEEEHARDAAAGWGGDRYAVYALPDAGEYVMVVRHRWDTRNDAEEFAAAFVQYADSRFGAALDQTTGSTTWAEENGIHVFFTSGDETVWIFAPDEETARAIYQHLQESG